MIDLFIISKIIFLEKNYWIFVCGPGLLGRQVNIYLNLPETTSFLNKEGNKNKIVLLKFENLTEIIKDNVGNNLFQNKNGNVKIQKLYQLEMNKIPNYMTYDVEWNNMNSHSQTSSLNYPHSSTLYPSVTHAKKKIIKSNKITQYTINNNNPAHYNYARTVNFGIDFNF